MAVAPFARLAARGGACLSGLALLLGTSAVHAQAVDAAPPATPAPAASGAEPADESAPSQREDARAARRAARALRNRQVGADWNVEIDAPSALASLLERYLDVSRFRHADTQYKVTISELSRLVAAAPAQARSLLETEGYYAAKVDAGLELPTDEPPRVKLKVDVGPQARVGRVTVDVQGTLADRAREGDATAQGLVDALKRDWSLPENARFSASAWDAAKAGLMSRLRADAYPSASWVGSTAQVDPQTQQVRIFVIADSGPAYRFGPIEIEGLSRYEAPGVLNLAPFAEGQPYNEQQMLDYQERVARMGLFDSVSVSIEPDVSRADAIPVKVRVREMQAQQATVGVGVSADSGPRVSLEHTHRKPFGWNWIAKSKIQLARDDRSVQFDLTSHPKPRAYRNLISGLVSREQATGLIVRETQARLGRTQDTERIERLYYLELLDSSTTSIALGTRRSVGAVTGNYEWVWRDVDSSLLPTRGLTASARVGAGHSFGVSGSDERAGYFTLARGRVVAYQPFGGHWFSTSRLELGQAFAADSTAIPYPLLFRAGGDNSVRGYNYQSLGPADEDDISVGGRVLGTASIEVARPFKLDRPEFLGAVFVDVGDAAKTWKDFSPVLGVGVGVRWRSPVGPLSLDLAYGRDVHKFRLHFNVGIAF